MPAASERAAQSLLFFPQGGGKCYLASAVSVDIENRSCGDGAPKLFLQAYRLGAELDIIFLLPSHNAVFVLHRVEMKSSVTIGKRYSISRGPGLDAVALPIDTEGVGIDAQFIEVKVFSLPFHSGRMDPLMLDTARSCICIFLPGLLDGQQAAPPWTISILGQPGQRKQFLISKRARHLLAPGSS